MSASRRLGPGGTQFRDPPRLPDTAINGERVILSGTNNTREAGREFLRKRDR
jgi:hypothetical protein